MNAKNLYARKSVEAKANNFVLLVNRDVSEHSVKFAETNNVMNHVYLL